MKATRWQQVEELYHSTLEKGAGERSAFLAEASAGDEELRREVESLLAYEDQAVDFIESPALDLAAKLVAEDRLTTLAAGQTIKHYKITSPLGAGGMGEVYLAEDTRLGRRVALKFLPAHFTQDMDRLRRFEQEARAVAALSHPNVCTIHEVVETGEGRVCIVMEYIDGVTLRQRLAEGEINVADALHVAVQVAAALSAAHAAGIVHRDIKPENIMLRSDDLVKVLDFGLAKLAPLDASMEEGAHTELTVKTNPGLVMGTVHYMSPEQARGQNVDARTDIWSLGVVSYEMLGNRPPFTGETSSHVIVSILESEPPPLARYRDVPAELERIVTKALRKNKEERYQAVSDLARELKSLKQELEVEARLVADRHAPTTRSSGELIGTGSAAANSDMSVALKKKRKAAFLAVAVGLALLAALAYILFLRKPAPVARTIINSVAVLPFKSLGPDDSDDYLGMGIAETLTTKLSSLKLLTVRPSSVAFKSASPGKETVVAGRELGVDAVLEGSIRRADERLRVTARLINVRDGSLLWAENFDENFTDIFRVEDSISAKVAEALSLKLSGEEEQRLTKRSTDNAEAYQLYLKGRFLWNKRTEDGFKKGITFFQQAVEKEPNYALAYAGISDSYQGLTFYNFAAPNDTMPQAKQAALNALALDNKLAEAHASLAHVLVNYDWNLPEAEREFKRSIELDPDYATAHEWYAIHSLTATGRMDDAVLEMKRAVELEPTSLVMNSFMGATLNYAGRTDEAIEQCRRTIEMDPNFAVAHWHLGLAYEQKGMLDQAVSEFEKAVALSKGSPLMKAALAHGYARSNKKIEATKILNELKDLSRQRYVSSYEVAAVYVALGDNDQAFRLLEEAFKEHCFHLVFLNVWPQFSPLRSDPRFQGLVRRLGLSV